MICFREASESSSWNCCISNSFNISYSGQGFPAVLAVKNGPANAGDVRDMGSVPGSGRSPGVGCPGESPWTEECGRLQPIGSQRVRHD